MKRTKKVWAGTVGCIILVILMVTGCGPKMRPPHDVISNAEMAINRARDANAITYAPLDLKFAEEKVAKAKEAMSMENYEEADQLAQDAMLDAQVAETKSRAEKAKKVSQDMQENIDSLQQELQRNP
jgi:hypothetical protein